MDINKDLKQVCGLEDTLRGGRGFFFGGVGGCVLSEQQTSGPEEELKKEWEGAGGCGRRNRLWCG